MPFRFCKFPSDFYDKWKYKYLKKLKWLLEKKDIYQFLFSLYMYIAQRINVKDALKIFILPFEIQKYSQIKVEIEEIHVV